MLADANLEMPNTLDLNGKELILDADADTSITADTDDQIDIKIAGSDNLRIKANEIENVSGDFTLDVVGDITLDANGQQIYFAKNGTTFGQFGTESTPSTFTIESTVPDGDIAFKGNDGGSSITAMTIDMSEGGAATFSGTTIINTFLELKTYDDQANKWVLFTDTNEALSFNYNGAGNAEVVIDSSGNLFIGRTSAGDTGNGHSIRGGDSAIFSRDASGETMQVCRNDDTGELIRFKKNGTTVGHIGVATGTKLQINSDANNNLMFAVNGSNYVGVDTVRMYPENDNNYDLGLSSSRYDDIFATNGTIQTSDQNEKQDIASATAKELNVAKKLSALFKTFRWKDKVGEKGDKARTHTGIVAQEVQLAFKEEGLDASNYGLFTSDTWTNDDGKEQTRLGVRYPELFSFIFSSIEARLTALEAK
jgi:hypothetical protein